MTTYLIGSKKMQGDDPSISNHLANIHGTKTRPLCLCRHPGIDMYVAKIQGKFIIKRMPNSGGDHAPACDSYEPPQELSGLGQVMGAAIQENMDEGITSIKLDFSLSKGRSRAAPTQSGEGETDSVKTDGSKLSLRGTLHYLWEEAGFNRWAPSMAGKRNWFVIRKYLQQAAENKTTKGTQFGEILYIPETFNPEKKNELTQRRMAKMMKISAQQNGTRHLMLVIGEVKEVTQSRYGHKIVLKHLPDFHFMLNEDIHKRFCKRFEMELGLWNAIEGTHLMLIGTFGIGSTGVASLEEAAVMIVTENWLPFENTFEKILLDTLTQENRKFVKGMRYNLPSSKPLACTVLSDTDPEATAMYILPPGANEAFTTAMAELRVESKLPSWLWEVGESEMPQLPSPLA